MAVGLGVGHDRAGRPLVAPSSVALAGVAVGVVHLSSKYLSVSAHGFQHSGPCCMVNTDGSFAS